MKIKYLCLLLLSLHHSAVYADVDLSEIQSLADFTDQVMEKNHLSTIEPQIKLQIQQAQQYVQPLLKSTKISYNDSVYLHNYAIITSQYAEYLLEQHCIPLSIPYQKKTEEAYLALLKRDPNDKIALNNLGLFYAKMSVYYRKNTDPTPRLENLNKAEQLFSSLMKLDPGDKEHQTNYYAVLSDKLMLLQKHHRDFEEQKRLMNIIKKPLFKYLSNPKSQLNAIDTGNFLILVQQYFKILNTENPQVAIKWLSDNQSKIEAIVQKNHKYTQRENEFLAEFYALLEQPKQALHYLKQFEVSNDEATTPDSIENEPNLANLKLNAEYQQWFKQYKHDYEEYRKAIPKLCKITQLEAIQSLDIKNY